MNVFVPDKVRVEEPCFTMSPVPLIAPVTTDELLVVLTVKEVKSDTVLCKFTCPDPVFKVKPAETLLLTL